MMRVAYALSTAALAAAVACSQSDPGVTTAVKSKLAADDTVKAYQIDVDTNDRVVTLSGTVETEAQKDQAVMVARQTDGVREVVDQITVNPGAKATTGELREEAREAGQAANEAGGDLRREAGQAADRAGAVASDAAVTAAVKSKFLADTAVSGLKIDVDTNGGVVTLNGAVATKAEADRAMSLARETGGVTRVVNNLRVGR